MIRCCSKVLILSALVLPAAFSGCAEGPMWRSGQWNPWARNKWAEEEAIANTLFSRKQKMSDSVAAVLRAPLDQQQTVAKELSDIAHRDPVLLLRIHAVNLSGRLNCPAALQTLEDASRDYNTDIRLAAVKAWEQKPSDLAIPQLQELIGSDTNVDVRLAATRAMSNFTGQQAITALQLALNDRDPALQIRATESLAQVTGENLGPDVVAWQNYVDRFLDDGGARVSAESSDKPQVPATSIPLVR